MSPRRATKTEGRRPDRLEILIGQYEEIDIELNNACEAREKVESDNPEEMWREPRVLFGRLLGSCSRKNEAIYVYSHAEIDERRTQYREILRPSDPEKFDLQTREYHALLDSDIKQRQAFRQAIGWTEAKCREEAAVKKYRETIDAIFKYAPATPDALRRKLAIVSKLVADGVDHDEDHLLTCLSKCVSRMFPPERFGQDLKQRPRSNNRDV